MIRILRINEIMPFILMNTERHLCFLRIYLSRVAALASVRMSFRNRGIEEDIPERREIGGKSVSVRFPWRKSVSVRFPWRKAVSVRFPNGPVTPAAEISPLHAAPWLAVLGA